jgi:enoyl-CoA hydratase
VGWETDRYAELSAAWAADGIAQVTLDAPARRNAMSDAMTDSWVRLMAGLAADRDVRAVIVTGAGSAFCAGGDLSWLGASPDATVDELRARMSAFYRSWLAIRDVEVPTIAAVNGPAVGAGLTLALACDLRYAAEDARLSAPFTALGLHPGMATTYLLEQAVGLPAARELLLTGRAVSGAEAVGLGLVNGTFPADALADEVLAVARRVAACGPVATRLATATLRTPPRSLPEALEREALAQAVTLVTDDVREGLAARRERRTPRFTGR